MKPLEKITISIRTKNFAKAGRAAKRATKAMERLADACDRAAKAQERLRNTLPLEMEVSAEQEGKKEVAG